MNTFKENKLYHSNTLFIFQFFNRRCVTFDECATMENPANLLSSDEDVPKSYKVFNNESCILDCPNNYMSVQNQHICKPCEGE